MSVIWKAGLVLIAVVVLLVVWVAAFLGAGIAIVRSGVREHAWPEPTPWVHAPDGPGFLPSNDAALYSLDDEQDEASLVAAAMLAERDREDAQVEVLDGIPLPAGDVSWDIPAEWKALR